MKAWSEKTRAHHNLQKIGLAATVLLASVASLWHKSSMRPRSMDRTTTRLLAPRSLTAIARPMINRERVAEWV